MKVTVSVESLKPSILSRCAVRKYNDKAIEEAKRAELEEFVDKLNSDFALIKCNICHDAAPFMKPILIPMIRNVKSALVIEVLKEQPPEVDVQIGIAGELFVLKATELGLGSVWIGSDGFGYSQKKAKIAIKTNNPCPIVIPFGYTDLAFEERQRKADSEITKDWKGSADLLKALKRAPSAMNKEPWKFSGGSGAIEVLVENTATEQGKFMNNWLDCGIAIANGMAFTGMRSVAFEKDRIILRE